MSDAHVTRIELFNHHVLPDHVIDLHGEQHLVITGPNGAGKTTLLAQVYADLTESIRREQVASDLERVQQRLDRGRDDNRNRLLLTNEAENKKRQLETPWAQCTWDGVRPHVDLYLRASRNQKFAVPSGPKRLDLIQVTPAGPRGFGSAFLQLLVNKHTTLHMSTADDPNTAATVQAELDHLRDVLRDLLAEPGLHFAYDRTTFGLDIVLGDRPLVWNHLAAGHHAVLEIVADIYARCMLAGAAGLETPGLVLIDEPELHLHPELQERILPGLTGLFPNVQFLVATHSAPVICSLDNAWVHDLRDQQGIASRELQGRPYGSVLEAHFQVPTDYDIATTRKVLAALDIAGQARTPDEMRRARDLVESFLPTEDPRVVDMWSRLNVELEG